LKEGGSGVGMRSHTLHQRQSIADTIRLMSLHHYKRQNLKYTNDKTSSNAPLSGRRAQTFRSNKTGAITYSKVYKLNTGLRI